MAVKVDIPFKGNIEVPGPLESVRAYVTAWEQNLVRNFPGLEKLEPKGPNEYTWIFQNFSYQSISFTLKTTTRFEVQGNVARIIPSGTDEMATFSGEWTFSGSEPTRVRFTAQMELELPIPKLMKAMAQPLARKELGGLMERFLKNVEKNYSA